MAFLENRSCLQLAHDDMKMMIKNPYRIILIVILLSAVPLIIRDAYFLRLINLFGISALLTISFNLLIGFTGQISIGQAAFYGIGAYTSALVCSKLGVPFWVGFSTGGVVAALFGLILGPVLRLPGMGLIMATYYFGEIIRMTMIEWESLTNGPRGISDIIAPAVGSLRFVDDRHFYYLIFACVFINYFVISRIVNSRIGRAMRAIKNDLDAAESLGVSSMKYKILAFVIAGFFSGLAGSLYAHSTGFIDPETFNINKSVEILAMVVMGGVGSITGSVLGAGFITVLPEIFRVFEDYRLILFGISILIILIFFPKGLAGLFQMIKERIAGDDTT